MLKRRGVLWVGILVLSLVGNGCSFLFVNAPPREELWNVPSVADPATCSESYALPILDTLVIPIDLLLGLASKDGLIFLIDVGWGILHLASAIHGYSRVGDCNDFMDHKTRRLLQNVSFKLGDDSESDLSFLYAQPNQYGLVLQAPSP